MRRFISLIKFSSLPLLFLPQPTGQSAFGRVVLKYSFQSLNTQKLLPGKLSSAFLRETRVRHRNKLLTAVLQSPPLDKFQT